MGSRFSSVVKEEMLAEARQMEEVFSAQQIRARVRDMVRGPQKTRYVVELLSDIQSSNIYALLENVSGRFQRDGVRLILTVNQKQITVEMPNATTRS